MKKYLLIIIVLLQACSADESLKVPSGFGIRFDVNREFSKDDRLYFLDGEMLISRLKLEGDRVQAEDYFFQNGYQPPLKVSLDADFNSELSFDLPQGIYSRIELDFEIPSANIPVLTINGRFKDSTDTWLPLRIEVSSFEYFQILATDYRGEQEIVIEDQRSYCSLGKSSRHQRTLSYKKRIGVSRSYSFVFQFLHQLFIVLKVQFFIFNEM